ncbi:MAG TPA: MFS transporter [Cryptosporangiaceae bacterium]|nr:MFS transporter [Cryptosporangiaceae bacterium]
MRERPFRRYWIGQTISSVGDEISSLALPLVAVVGLGATAAEMGYLTAAGLLPSLLFSLYAGAWVDRQTRRRRLMILTDLGRALLVVSIPVAYALHALTTGHLYVVAFLVGTLATVFTLANSTLFPVLVRPSQYVAANSLVNGSRAGAYVVGPSLAGGLVHLLSAPFALVADAVSYLVSALFLGRIAPTEPRPEAPGRGLVLAGLTFLARSSIVRTTLLATATLNFFNFMFAALFILYVTTSLHISAGLLGAVVGVGALGALLGSFLTGRIVRWIGIDPTYAVGLIVFPAPLMLIPLAGGPLPLVLGLLFVAEFAAGFGVMLLDIAVGSIHAAVIPYRMRARVAGAFRTVNYGIRPLGALAGGGLGTAIGLRPTLWIATAGALLGILWLLPSPLLRLRDLPAPEGVEADTDAAADTDVAPQTGASR